MGQRRGYLGIQELQDAGAAERKLIEKKNLKKKNRISQKRKRRKKTNDRYHLTHEHLRRSIRILPKEQVFIGRLLLNFLVDLLLTYI